MPRLTRPPFARMAAWSRSSTTTTACSRAVILACFIRRCRRSAACLAAGWRSRALVRHRAFEPRRFRLTALPSARPVTGAWTGARMREELARRTAPRERPGRETQTAVRPTLNPGASGPGTCRYGRFGKPCNTVYRSSRRAPCTGPAARPVSVRCARAGSRAPCAGPRRPRAVRAGTAGSPSRTRPSGCHSIRR